MPRTALELLAADEARSGNVALQREREARSTNQISSLSNPSDALLRAFGAQPTKSGASVTPDTALTVTTVYACTRLISGIIARLPIRLLRTTPVGFEEVTDHPAVNLVKFSPDGARSSFAWRRMMELISLLRGNAAARIIRDDYFQPIGLKWMNPIEVEFWRTPDGDPFYRYRGQLLLPDDVFLHKDMSMDGVTGISPITCMREAVGLAMTTQEHASRYFSNGAQPGLVLVAPLAATKPQMDLMRDELNRNHGGVGNSSKAMVLAGGMTVNTIPLNNADSQFLESRAFDVEEIARAYGVPPHLIGATGKVTSWGTGIEQMNRGFIDYTIGDRLVNWEQELNMNLLTAADLANGLYFKFDTDELTKGTALERAQVHQIYRNIAAESVNDVRRDIGYDDLPDNIGDDYRLTFNGAGGIPAAKPANQPAEKEAA